MLSNKHRSLLTSNVIFCAFSLANKDVSGWYKGWYLLVINTLLMILLLMIVLGISSGKDLKHTNAYYGIKIASVILLDCSDGVYPLVGAVFTCQVTDGAPDNTALQWLSSSMMPASIGIVSTGVPIREANGYTAMYTGNGSSTLSFIATTDRNTTNIQCLDVTDLDKQNCTVTIAG